ncbi:3,4-dihydroxyphenylacetaldehyde synthase 2-like [Frieseomelitta varia]|uniref:3,4-dihydroxyphenylacetaldehyde synthase 2-like n=1 Tax=Frieseomelitta varia TaxID=561572 RepID=UPI001CB679B2|nr:3,4-dihydroxyphenylacetaldehyde synthase 2-like [Frieseomelitta varia]
MDTKDFIDFGKAVIDFVANYTETLREKNVLPNVEPRYLFNLLPEKAPQKPESWQEVFKDVERYIMPGMTHWNSPQFHAFYPTGNSYPAIIGDIIANGFGCIGLSWISSPACTELEMIMMNWLGKLLGLPKQFLSSNEGFGGGVIQGSASEVTLLCLIASREQATLCTKRLHPELDEAIIKTKLIAYASDQSNSSVERGALLASVPIRLLPTDDKCALRGETLLKAVKEDLKKGLIPCCVIANLGTTGTCAFDNLVELGPICKEYNMWLHIDAAYAGAAFACPEYRHLMSGIEYADSFNVNAHKWLLVNFDCSLLWLKDSRKLVEACSVDRIYLKHDKQGLIPDYRNWQIPLGRRFRSLKVWFVLRLYGVEGIQQYIRRSIQLAEMFENYVKSDSRFELVTERVLSLVCFRMKGDNQLTQELINRVTVRRKIYIIAATYREKLIVRLVIGSRLTREDDVMFAWNEITSQATEILRTVTPPLEKVSDNSLETQLWQNQKV